MNIHIYEIVGIWLISKLIMEDHIDDSGHEFFMGFSYPVQHLYQEDQEDQVGQEDLVYF